jgi:hypothetical protein
MKSKGYIVGLLFGIPLFIVAVNFLFFRGNSPSNNDVNQYISQSIIDTILVKAIVPEGEQYITSISRRGQPSAFLDKYPAFSKKYNKHFVVMIFDGFDPNTQNRGYFLCSGDFNTLTIRINQNQLRDARYGTKQNPVPVFAIDMLNLKWKGAGCEADPFHVSDRANFIFVEEYLKFFMPEDEFEKMFKK